ncbi:GNAT family N-acetyltransferase [Fictibacillus fluitans]|uniref:GNAT family N-acetyltransferase n=1 Tax=Fictibacillus fluitans TaxID=3058422 RepID=A0ABT8HXW9_9BACL|nr:GNAT family N-acetyltransferase [Fictibacillus sp. NE201]MDN4525625.1 GNAT family N-acetyltransferase [Fictibacillus sp. NE201]
MEIRKALPGDEEAIAFVHVDSWRTTYKGVVDEEYLQKMSVEDRKAMWKGIIEKPLPENQLYVACINQEIIGFCSGGANRTGRFLYDGEIYAIYILQEYQRRSIGSRLIRKLAQGFLDSGYHTMLVWVLQDNPCKVACERLGGILLGEEKIQIGDQELVEEAIGFDLARVLNL